MPAALDVNWQEVRRAAELGAELRHVAAQFGVSIEAVRKRAQREEWLTPHKLHDRLMMAKANANLGASGGGVSDRPLSRYDISLLKEKEEARKQQDKDRTETLLADTWEARGEQIRSQAWLIAQKSLKPAIEQGLMITTIKEANTAIEMARKATGQFQEQAMVSLSMYGESGSGFLQNVHDVASSPIVDMEDDSDWV